jgi:hypothetical protein
LRLTHHEHVHAGVLSVDVPRRRGAHRFVLGRLMVLDGDDVLRCCRTQPWTRGGVLPGMPEITDAAARPDASSEPGGWRDRAGGRSRVFRLIYSSVAVTGLDEDELQLLLGISQRLNEQASITGILLHVHDRDPASAFFVQLLEGPQESVEAAYARIARDELHDQLTVLARDRAAGRAFSGWSLRLQELAVPQMPEAPVSTGTASPAVQSVQSVLSVQSVSEWIRDPAAMNRLVLGFRTS